MKYFIYLTLCFLLATAQEDRMLDDVEADELMNSLCKIETVRDVADCGELLSLQGKDIIFNCCRNLTDSDPGNMIVAIETFCYREDIRDMLFTCWENGLSKLYDTTVDEDELKDMDNFLVCFQEVMDGIFVN
ncbi:uncharacterized protein LOC118187050 [Stegodyphus dumicola]|uniref:uncharacterized protein LOC118187050 n=1 Tax=Stegodyphus dumicola TaxID=202533 RepID=UPI0015AA6695|nr:uncharacterized protein LOC118187050 [Stegodyphus dumicola]